MYDHSKACVQYYNGSLRHDDCQQTKYFICERSRSKCVFKIIVYIQAFYYISRLNTSVSYLLIPGDNENSFRTNCAIFFFDR